MSRIRFYKNLYVSEGISNPNKVKWKLRHNAGQFSIYVITPAAGDDELEIYHCAFLQQEYYKKNPPYIIGIAESYEEAVNIVVQITEAAYAENGNAKLKEYLFQKTKR